MKNMTFTKKNPFPCEDEGFALNSHHKTSIHIPDAIISPISLKMKKRHKKTSPSKGKITRVSQLLSDFNPENELVNENYQHHQEKSTPQFVSLSNQRTSEKTVPKPLVPINNANLEIMEKDQKAIAEEESKFDFYDLKAFPMASYKTRDISHDKQLDKSLETRKIFSENNLSRILEEEGNNSNKQNSMRIDDESINNDLDST